MRDSVPSARYSPFVMYCIDGESGSSLLIESLDTFNSKVTMNKIIIYNFLNAIIIYYIQEGKNIFKMNKEVRILLPKNELIQVEQGK